MKIPFVTSALVALVAASFVTGCADTGDDQGTQTEADELRETPCGALSDVPNMKTFRLDADGGKVHLRVGVAAPSRGAIGDVLYLHGFADRFDNHEPLFEAWREAGYRVIAFDYPSHGETCGRPIDGYGFGDLASFAKAVEEKTREDARRPLLVAGWSTGGLLAVRMLQKAVTPLGRPLAGGILFAPAVAPRTLVGEAGFVTEETLTRNPSPPHRGEITPKSPLLTPLFAPVLLSNAKLASLSGLPKDIPTLVVLGGDDTDRYVDTKRVASWAADAKEEGARVFGRACAGGFHELDNEPGAMGTSVRSVSTTFAKWAVEGARGTAPEAVTKNDGACRAL